MVSLQTNKVIIIITVITVTSLFVSNVLILLVVRLFPLLLAELSPRVQMKCFLFILGEFLKGNRVQFLFLFILNLHLDPQARDGAVKTPGNVTETFACDKSWDTQPRYPPLRAAPEKPNQQSPRSDQVLPSLSSSEEFSVSERFFL